MFRFLDLRESHEKQVPAVYAYPIHLLIHEKGVRLHILPLVALSRIVCTTIGVIFPVMSMSACLYSTDVYSRLTLY